MKILVSGGAGFIGSHLVDAYLKNGYDVFVVDNLSSGTKANLNPKAGFFKIDIRDFDSLQKTVLAIKPEIINHHAAQTSVGQSQKDPQADAATNITGTINLLKIAGQIKVRRFIFASSAAVYGEKQHLPISEKARLDPFSPYGISKMTGEKYCQYFSRSFGLPVCIFRYANVYGSRQKVGLEAGAITIFIDRLKKNQVLEIYGDGNQTRDFVWVEDIVKVNQAALKSEAWPIVLNAGSGTRTSINDLARLLGRLGKVKAQMIYGPARPGEIRHSFLDSKRLKNQLNFPELTSPAQGLARLLVSEPILL